MKTYFPLLLFVVAIAVSSCKKGECTCTILGSEITTSHTADDRDEYKNLKSDCESAGCEWSAKM